MSLDMLGGLPPRKAPVSAQPEPVKVVAAPVDEFYAEMSLDLLGGLPPRK